MQKLDKENQTKTKKPINYFRRKQLAFFWGWLAIPLVSWLIFYWYVNFQSFVQAFQDPITNEWSLINFKDVWKSMTAGMDSPNSLAVGFVNTMKYFFLGILVHYPIQIIFCYFLYKQIFGYKAFRYIFYLPAIISAVAISGVFKQFIAASGPIGELLTSIGVEIPKGGFLGNPDTATNTIMVYTTWLCVHGHLLLVCGAMNRIPVEVLEAARLEGVKPFGELYYLILPLIWPTLSTLLILSCTGILNSSGPILLLAPETNVLRTTTLNYWIFERVYAGGIFANGQFNLVSAMGLVMTLVSFPIVLLFRKLLDYVPTVEY